MDTCNSLAVLHEYRTSAYYWTYFDVVTDLLIKLQPESKKFLRVCPRKKRTREFTLLPAASEDIQLW